ncbi:hypothetical protein LIER_03649 [Lithospermum erythrorhizon]|uniref:TPX2 central domain-containing protein n=1 Tax=Lithospermum erythrorhizon TaxID=34254 RepID=A0AAV3NWN1_LITER
MNEEHMHDFIDGINFACDNDFEVDLNYEFDAVSFYDFTRPETIFEIEEAETWFHYADSYPHSPFVMKLMIEKLLASQECCTSSNSKESQNTDLNINKSESKSKLANKATESSSFGYMKPTASLLAKQNKLQEANCKHLKIKPEKKCLRSPRYGDLLSKRQKLERGYLLKVTVPKEPQLETMLRAERRGSRNTSESSEKGNAKVHAIKEQSRNSLVHLSRLSSQKSAQQLIECQVLDTHWDDSVVRSSVATVKSSTPKGVPEKQYYQRSPKSNTRPLEEKEYKTSNEERLLQNPPIEEFSKLSIKSRSEKNLVSETRLNRYV